nr:MAG TPA: hypothetical protein [Caudoviricetes sp.]
MAALYFRSVAGLGHWVAGFLSFVWSPSRISSIIFLNRIKSKNRKGSRQAGDFRATHRLPAPVLPDPYFFDGRYLGLTGIPRPPEHAHTLTPTSCACGEPPPLEPFGTSAAEEHCGKPRNVGARRKKQPCNGSIKSTPPVLVAIFTDEPPVSRVDQLQAAANRYLVAAQGAFDLVHPRIGIADRDILDDSRRHNPVGQQRELAVHFEPLARGVELELCTVAQAGFVLPVSVVALALGRHATLPRKVRFNKGAGRSGQFAVGDALLVVAAPRCQQQRKERRQHGCVRYFSHIFEV